MQSDGLVPVRFADRRPMLLGGLRRHHSFAESGRLIPQQWQQLDALGRIPGQLGRIRYGVMCGHEPGGIEFMCGVEVDSFAGLTADLGRMRIPPQHYAVFRHCGPTDTLLMTWERSMREWLPHSAYESARTPDFEVHDPDHPDSVEIWIGVSAR